MMLKQLLIILVLIAAFNNAIAKDISFNIDSVVDIQTNDGRIIPITSIIDGNTNIASISINNKFLTINTYNPQNIVIDVQLYNGDIIDMTDITKLVYTGGGDIGGGGNK